MRTECPSGLIVEQRRLKTKEANILADATAARKGVQFDNLLSSITEAVLDAGPYALKDGKLDWADVLVGDRVYAQLQARIATFGAEYEFSIQCPSCRESFQWGEDLSKLGVQKLRADDAKTFQEGNRFEIEYNGFAYTFELLTGKTSRKASELLKSNPHGRITASLLARVKTIRDSSGAEVMNRRGHFDDMDLSETQGLVEALDEYDCGIETGIEVECPNCGAVSGVELPFDRREYWAPKPKGKTPRRDS